MQQLNDISPKQILASSCFSVPTHQAVNTICSQALNKLSLSAFEFARVYDDGTAIILYSDPRIAKYVVEKQLHISAHVPKSILNTQFWYLPEPNGPYSQNVHDIKDVSSSNSFANYIQRFAGYYDMFCFWSTADQPLGSNQFINNKETLEQFSSNFLDRAKELILYTDRDRFTLTQSMAPNFGGLNAEEPRQDNFHLRLYLEKIQQGLTKFGPSLFPNLTNRELDCIQFLILGSTANEMANTMGISQRTVEMHLNSTRNKLGCTKKSSIIKTLMEQLDIDHLE
jgi:DNA-binding CsgD family transcriptional regulator